MDIRNNAFLFSGSAVRILKRLLCALGEQRQVQKFSLLNERLRRLKGLFTLNAILIRFVVARNFIQFWTQAVDGNIFNTI